MITIISNLKLNYRQEIDNFIEVALESTLPQEVVNEYGLQRFELSVRFYENGDKIIHIWDIESEQFRDELYFEDKVTKEIIEFAEQYRESVKGRAD